MFSNQVDNFTDNVNLDDDNLGSGDGSEGNTSDFSLDDFFGQLEREVNGAVFDAEEPVTRQGKEGSEGKSGRESGSEDNGKEESAEPKDELKTLRKRYEDSSREAKRLKSELDELSEYKDYIPILKTLRQDPNLVQVVSDYLDKGTGPRSVKEMLNLPEDFVFDPDEAVSDPESDSAKVLSTMVDQRVQQRIAVEERKASEARQRMQGLEALKERHKMSDDEVDELLEWGRQNRLTLDDLYYLKNRDKIERELVSRTTSERETQARRMRQSPRSLASAGSEEGSEPTPDEAVFGAISKAMGVDSPFEL